MSHSGWHHCCFFVHFFVKVKLKTVILTYLQDIFFSLSNHRSCENSQINIHLFLFCFSFSSLGGILQNSGAKKVLGETFQPATKSVSGTFSNSLRLLLTHLVSWINSRLNTRFYWIMRQMSPVHQNSSLRLISRQQHGTNLLCAASAEIGWKLGENVEHAGRVHVSFQSHSIFSPVFASFFASSVCAQRHLTGCCGFLRNKRNWGSLMSRRETFGIEVNERSRLQLPGTFPPHTLTWEPHKKVDFLEKRKKKSNSLLRIIWLICRLVGSIFNNVQIFHTRRKIHFSFMSGRNLVWYHLDTIFCASDFFRDQTHCVLSSLLLAFHTTSHIRARSVELLLGPPHNQRARRPRGSRPAGPLARCRRSPTSQPETVSLQLQGSSFKESLKQFQRIGG